MLFRFGAYSSLLLPFVLAGAVATGGLLLRAMPRRALPDALLALLLAVPTLNIARQMLEHAGWYEGPVGYRAVMFYVPWQLNLLLGPGYYLYFRSLTNQEFRLGRRAWWHLLPGLLQLGLAVGVPVCDALWRGAIQGQPLPYQGGALGPALAVADSLGHALGYFQYVLLPAYCWRVLADYRRYTHYLHDNFSDPERLRFAGLRQLILVQVLALALSQLFTVLDWKFGLSDTASWSYFFLRGFLVYWLIAVGLQANYAAATTPLRFDTAPDEPLPATPTTDLLPTPAAAEPAAPAPTPTAELPPAQLAPELLAWRDKLLALMADEQPWLEPELTLTELAKRLRIAPALLSKVINAGCEQNFNDFVNAYRVREAQRLLADPRFAHYSLVGVALESGFNSRSTFNRVFKKVTGQAPSELTRPKS
jgi:AraC-like DNA-binding protein